MRITSIAVSALFVVSLCTSGKALAGWQWTNWGMTRSQFEQAAIKHRVAVTEAAGSKPEQVELNAPYSAVGMIFQARFIFNDRGGLMEVVLRLNDASQCPVLEEFVKSSYGVPYDTYNGYGLRTLSWRDEKTETDVKFGLYGPAGYQHHWCDIEYSRLAKHGENGL